MTRERTLNNNSFQIELGNLCNVKKNACKDLQEIGDVERKNMLVFFLLQHKMNL